MNELSLGHATIDGSGAAAAQDPARARLGRVVLLSVALALAVGLFAGAALFPRLVEVPTVVEKTVMVRDDKAIDDATKHIHALKSTVKSLTAQVALLQARTAQADTVPIEPMTLAPDAKGLERDALAILSEFGVTTVQVKECR